MADEAARGFPDEVPRYAAAGWERFAERAPKQGRGTVLTLRRELTPLVMRWRRRRRRSCTGTGRWATSGSAVTGARSSSTGPIAVPARCATSSVGTSR